MPDSPSDDPFADLFGQLPDPRSRELRSSGEDAVGMRRLPGLGRHGAPLSRRAAREAAAQQSLARRGRHAAPRRPGDRLRDSAAAAPAAAATAVGPHAVADAPSVDRGVRRHSRSPSPPMTSRGSSPVPPPPRAAPVPPRRCRAARRRRAVDRARRRSTATLESLFTGSGTTDQVGAAAAAQEQAQAPHRRLDRPRRRPRDPRRHRRRRPLGLEHLRGPDPRGHGLGGAQGLRRRDSRTARLYVTVADGDTGAADLAGALRRGRHEDAGRRSTTT